MTVFSVSQINRIIKDLIDNEVLLEDVVVAGELSSFSVTRNIAYFCLKDNENLLNCVQFGCKQEFKIGDLVQIRGNIKYYPKGGKLTFNALSIELCGQGELYQKFIELKNKLEKEGLFDENHKIPLPRFVKSIGVVTSKTGAVLQDIKNVSSRRNPGLDIFVYDAQVQGKYAVQDIIQGITYFDNMTDVDVIVVARGGGSIEDLMPFNDEELAHIAYICNKPIISAVGHETDFSILDFVADLRAPTPSAAAEIVSFDQKELKRYIQDLNSQIKFNVENQFNNHLSAVNTFALNIENAIINQVNDEILCINNFINKIDQKATEYLNATKYRVDTIISALNTLNPINILKRGYADVTTENGARLNYENAKLNSIVNIKTHDANYQAMLTKKEKIC